MSKLFETLLQHETASGDLPNLLNIEDWELFGNLVTSRAVVNHKAPVRLSAPGMTGDELALWFSQELMEDLATVLLGGYERSLWGGIEVGGVFFGTAETDGVHIKCYRPIISDHQHGPAFRLSKRDLDHLTQLLADAAQDESLDGLVPVGWFHTACNRPAAPDEHDTAVHDRFFTQPWQMAMILKGSQKGPVTINLSFREDKRPTPLEPGPLLTLADFRSRSGMEQSEAPVRVRLGSGGVVHRQPLRIQTQQAC
jgi:hypothetical protein